MSVARSGAVNINAASGPTAHAVGYYLPPLRGSGVLTLYVNAHGCAARAYRSRVPAQSPGLRRAFCLRLKRQNHFNKSARIVRPDFHGAA